MSENKSSAPIDVKQIMRMIPHRYPILLVDRIWNLHPVRVR